MLGEKDEEVSFALLKEKLSASFVLALPKFDKLFDVKYDTFGKGLGFLSPKRVNQLST